MLLLVSKCLRLSLSSLGFPLQTYIFLQAVYLCCCWSPSVSVCHCHPQVSLSRPTSSFKQCIYVAAGLQVSPSVIVILRFPSLDLHLPSSSVFMLLLVFKCLRLSLSSLGFPLQTYIFLQAVYLCCCWSSSVSVCHCHPQVSLSRPTSSFKQCIYVAAGLQVSPSVIVILRFPSLDLHLPSSSVFMLLLVFKCLRLSLSSLGFPLQTYIFLQAVYLCCCWSSSVSVCHCHPQVSISRPTSSFKQCIYVAAGLQVSPSVIASLGFPLQTYIFLQAVYLCCCWSPSVSVCHCHPQVSLSRPTSSFKQCIYVLAGLQVSPSVIVILRFPSLDLHLPSSSVFMLLLVFKCLRLSLPSLGFPLQTYIFLQAVYLCCCWSPSVSVCHCHPQVSLSRPTSSFKLCIYVVAGLQVSPSVIVILRFPSLDLHLPSSSVFMLMLVFKCLRLSLSSLGFPLQTYIFLQAVYLCCCWSPSVSVCHCHPQVSLSRPTSSFKQCIYVAAGLQVSPSVIVILRFPSLDLHLPSSSVFMLLLVFKCLRLSLSSLGFPLQTYIFLQAVYLCCCWSSSVSVCHCHPQVSLSRPTSSFKQCIYVAAGLQVSPSVIVILRFPSLDLHLPSSSVFMLLLVFKCLRLSLSSLGFPLQTYIFLQAVYLCCCWSSSVSVCHCHPQVSLSRPTSSFKQCIYVVAGLQMSPSVTVILRFPSLDLHLPSSSVFMLMLVFKCLRLSLSSLGFPLQTYIFLQAVYLCCCWSSSVSVCHCHRQVSLSRPTSSFIQCIYVAAGLQVSPSVIVIVRFPSLDLHLPSSSVFMLLLVFNCLRLSLSSLGFPLQTYIFLQAVYLCCCWSSSVSVCHCHPQVSLSRPTSSFKQCIYVAAGLQVSPSVIVILRFPSLDLHLPSSSVFMLLLVFKCLRLSLSSLGFPLQTYIFLQAVYLCCCWSSNVSVCHCHPQVSLSRPTSSFKQCTYVDAGLQVSPSVIVILRFPSLDLHLPSSSVFMLLLVFKCLRLSLSSLGFPLQTYIFLQAVYLCCCWSSSVSVCHCHRQVSFSRPTSSFKQCIYVAAGLQVSPSVIVIVRFPSLDLHLPSSSVFMLLLVFKCLRLSLSSLGFPLQTYIFLQAVYLCCCWSSSVSVCHCHPQVSISRPTSSFKQCIYVVAGLQVSPSVIVILRFPSLDLHLPSSSVFMLLLVFKCLRLSLSSLGFPLQTYIFLQAVYLCCCWSSSVSVCHCHPQVSISRPTSSFKQCIYVAAGLQVSPSVIVILRFPSLDLHLPSSSVFMLLLVFKCLRLSLSSLGFPLQTYIFLQAVYLCCCWSSSVSVCHCHPQVSLSRPTSSFKLCIYVAAGLQVSPSVIVILRFPSLDLHLPSSSVFMLLLVFKCLRLSLSSLGFPLQTYIFLQAVYLCCCWSPSVSVCHCHPQVSLSRPTSSFKQCIYVVAGLQVSPSVIVILRFPSLDLHLPSSSVFMLLLVFKCLRLSLSSLGFPLQTYIFLQAVYLCCCWSSSVSVCQLRFPSLVYLWFSLSRPTSSFKLCIYVVAGLQVSPSVIVILRFPSLDLHLPSSCVFMLLLVSKCLRLSLSSLGFPLQTYIFLQAVYLCCCWSPSVSVCHCHPQVSLSRPTSSFKQCIYVAAGLQVSPSVIVILRFPSLDLHLPSSSVFMLLLVSKCLRLSLSSLGFPIQTYIFLQAVYLCCCWSPSVSVCHCHPQVSLSRSTSSFKLCIYVAAGLQVSPSVIVILRFPSLDLHLPSSCVFMLLLVFKCLRLSLSSLGFPLQTHIFLQAVYLCCCWSSSVSVCHCHPQVSLSRPTSSYKQCIYVAAGLQVSPSVIVIVRFPSLDLHLPSSCVFMLLLVFKCLRLSLSSLGFPLQTYIFLQAVYLCCCWSSSVSVCHCHPQVSLSRPTSSFKQCIYVAAGLQVSPSVIVILRFPSLDLHLPSSSVFMLLLVFKCLRLSLSSLGFPLQTYIFLQAVYLCCCWSSSVSVCHCHPQVSLSRPTSSFKQCIYVAAGLQVSPSVIVILRFPSLDLHLPSSSVFMLLLVFKCLRLSLSSLGFRLQTYIFLQAVYLCCCWSSIVSVCHCHPQVSLSRPTSSFKQCIYVAAGLQVSPSVIVILRFPSLDLHLPSSSVFMLLLVFKCLRLSLSSLGFPLQTYIFLQAVYLCCCWSSSVSVCHCHPQVSLSRPTSSFKQCIYVAAGLQVSPSVIVILRFPSLDLHLPSSSVFMLLLVFKCLRLSLSSLGFPLQTYIFLQAVYLC